MIKGFIWRIKSNRKKGNVPLQDLPIQHIQGGALLDHLQGQVQGDEAGGEEVIDVVKGGG